MPPTSFASSLVRRYSAYDCDDYMYMRECEPHRIIIGAIISFVVFLIVVITAMLCIRHRKHKSVKARAQLHPQPRLQHGLPSGQKQARIGWYDIEPELRAPPPAYARVDPARVV